MLRLAPPLCAALLAHALTYAPVRAQAEDAARPVAPGEVTTMGVSVSVPFPAPAGGPVIFHIDPAPGIVFYSPLDGAADWLVSEPVLPITLQLGAEAPAGLMRAGVLRVDWPDGSSTSRDILLDVSRRHDLRLVTWTGGGAAPGEPFWLHWRVENRGNATDTVRVRLLEPVAAARTVAELELRRGAGRSDSIRLEVDRAAIPGQGVRLQVAAEGRGMSVESRRVLSIAIPDEYPRWRELPATIFVGGSTAGAGGRDARTDLAIDATGRVGAGAQLRIAGRHGERFSGPLPFHEYVFGPRLLVDAWSDDWRVAAGDLSTGTSLLGLSTMYGRGGAARLDLGTLDAEAAVLDAGLTGGSEQGRSFLGRVGREGGLGRFELTGVHRDRSTAGSPTSTADVLGLRYEMPFEGTHRLAVEAGVMRLEQAGTDAETGPAAQMDYTYLDRDRSLVARARHVPALVPGLTGGGDELYLNGTHRLTDAYRALGSVFYHTSSLLTGGGAATDRGASGGVAWGRGGRSMRVLLERRESQGFFSTGASVVRDAVRAFGTTSLSRSMRLDAQADFGWRAFAGARDPYQSYRLTGRWTGADSEAWATLAYGRGDVWSDRARLDLHARRRFGDLRGELTLGSWLDASLGDSDIDGWAGLAYPLNDRFEAVGGVEYRPWGGGTPTRLSLGVASRLPLPTPLPNNPHLHGVLFEDLDLDGVRDPGEPGLADTRLRIGTLEILTDAQGRYTLLDPVPGTISVDPRSLPTGLVAPAAFRPGPHGLVDLPVVRLSQLQLRLFRDYDGDGARGGAEPPAPDLLVTLVQASTGGERVLQASSRGELLLSGIEPGIWRLIVEGHADRTGSSERVERIVEIAPGADLQETVAVRFRRREIRFGDGSVAAVAPQAEAEAEAARAQQAPPSDAEVAADAATQPDAAAHGAADDEPAAPAPPPSPVPSPPLPAADLETLRTPVYFGFDRAELWAEATDLLREKLDVLRRWPDARLCIAGHADTNGPEDYNTRLAMQRAIAVRRFLVQEGFEDVRFPVTSFSELHPVDTGNTVAAHARNRRVEFRVIESGAPLEEDPAWVRAACGW